jgi:capsular polysaccharide transport system ATP-binding protein
MIVFENVSKSFWTGRSRKVILQDATFRIELGRSLGILAPNGTGKTTIINMMAGLEHPDEGNIRRLSRISFPLGYMGGVNHRLTGTENTRHVAHLYGLDPDYVEAFCRWLCQLEDYFDMPVSTYSTGMRARLNLALLLSMQFEIYLIDEAMPPTTDADFNRRSGEILRQRLEGATVVVVSHQARTLEKFCTAAAILRDGRLTFFDTLEEAQHVYAATA